MTRRLVIWLLFAVSVISGGRVWAAVDAGQESPFALGAGARALGLGGAMTALPLDGSTVYYNPAGLPRLEYQEVSFTHQILFEGTKYDIATWAIPVVGLGGFGASFMRLGTGDILLRQNWQTMGTIDYSTWQALIAYGRGFGRYVSAGATFKVLNSSIGPFSDYGVGFEMGVQAGPYRHLTAGLMVRNVVPPQLSLDSSTERVPVTVVGGLAAEKLRLADLLHLSAAVDVEKFEQRTVKLHAGAELLYRDAYALRVGFDRENVTFGAGLSYSRFRIDYAYKVLKYLEDSHRFSLTVLLGPSMTQQRQKRHEEDVRRGRLLAREERQKLFADNKQRADSFYQRMELDSALTYYQRALAFEEHNAEVAGTIAAIQDAQRVRRSEEARIQARQDQQQFVRTYYDQAAAFYAKKYYPAALDLVNLVLDINPQHTQALALKADIEKAITQEIASSRAAASQAEAEGRVVEAIEGFNRVLELDPGDVAAKAGKQRLASQLDVAQQLKLGIDYYNEGRLDEARRHFEVVLKRTPNDAVAQDYMSKLGAAAPAASSLEDLQKDRDIWPLYLEGLRAMRNQEYDKAIQAWEKVLKAYPNNTNTIENIKQAKLRQKP